METILITGSSGIIGTSLITELAKTKKYAVIALDINELDDQLKSLVHENIVADILDRNIIENLLTEHNITTVIHLASIMPPATEENPAKAHEVIANGTANLLEAVNKYSQKEKQVIKFIFPSTIAAYGLPSQEVKTKANKIKEEEFLSPITMYGINKLYCENLGRYYSAYYQLLNTNYQRFIDFRCVRFPGLISAVTIPTGGTSDYGAEMIHSAAKGEGYESFVQPDTVLPFMVMPDAIKALLTLAEAPKEKLKSMVYNVSAFSVTAQQIADIVNKVFPDSAISYNPDINRQRIVDSWPADIDDSKARSDWGWQPDYDMERAFKDYLIPEIQKRYS